MFILHVYFVNIDIFCKIEINYNREIFTLENPVMKKLISLTVVSLLWATGGWAGEADVVAVAVDVEKQGKGRYTFSVTVRHADEGWSHYADGWEVVALDGTVLGKRELYHPHVSEQPFTRSLSGVMVPDGMREVVVRAHDSVHGIGGREQRVTLP